MPREPKPFKPTPKRFHPKGITLIYEDHDLLVVDKSGGLLTVAYEDQPGEISAHALLLNYVRKGNPKSHTPLHLVHRLDRDTSGVLVFAKSETARAYLIEEWSSFSKRYLAVVNGHLPEKEGVITSFLAEDPQANGYKMISVRDPSKGVFASTGYKVIRETPTRSLLEISLHTGKKNQIRVHLSEKGFPGLGRQKIRGPDPAHEKVGPACGKPQPQAPPHPPADDLRSGNPPAFRHGDGVSVRRFPRSRRRAPRFPGERSRVPSARLLWLVPFPGPSDVPAQVPVQPVGGDPANLSHGQQADGGPRDKIPHQGTVRGDPAQGLVLALKLHPPTPGARRRRG
jgi:23S rRNA-/tRNA-specific pseudouridylate synthase